MHDVKQIVEQTLEKNNGVLKLKPAWVARTFLSGGKRMGLKENEYYLGPERGWITERWLASTTQTDPNTFPEDEGLSYLDIESKENINMKEAIEVAGDLIMGKEYAKTHSGLGRLAKIYDYDDRVPYHIHQMEKHAKLVGRNPKEEAYYFPEGVDLGPHPETFFGVHPYIVDQKKYDILLPYLIDWNSDKVLQHSRAYLNVAGEGFHLPSGILHAPGTAVTLELQEDSDVLAMFQALVAGKIISKSLLYKDVRKEDQNEKNMLTQVDWEASGDPYIYENHHTYPQLINETKQEGGEEYWVYYNTDKFSGKKLVVKPGKSFSSIDNGVYNILVWKGKGTYDGHEIEAGNFGIDELLITHDKALKPLTVKNTGSEELIIIKFFGPEINKNIPFIKKYKS
jgi:hypothetical protein